MEKKQWSLQIGGRELQIETGLLAGQANGSVTVRYGDTMVLATATMSERVNEGMNYFPLMVDYEERYYAAGKIKGSRFIKREGRPSDEAVLNGRVVDRTIRPLFNHRMRNEVQVILTILSIDGENEPDTVAMIAASAALSISNIPWSGPVGGVRVGMVNGELIVNPVREEKLGGKLDLIVSGTKNSINMIEAGAKEVPEEKILEALELGHDAIKKIAELIESIKEEVGNEKVEVPLLKESDEFENKIKELAVKEGLADALYAGDKKSVNQKTGEIREKISAFVEENYPEEAGRMKSIADLVFDEISDEIVHKHILEKGERPDGRRTEEIRKIACEVGILPRTHGTGLFNRGETQVMTVTTLGAPGDEQIVDTMEMDIKKGYMHFYNFPPYSVGEVRFMRGPGRREIGHGALAEKALIPVLPEKGDFPYTMLLVSEVMACNGSSSMASVCGSTLSMLDAGVPLKRPVSGIAMGIIIDQENNENYKVLSDIQGLEDHFGDMDFKAAGTEEGLTAIQMDVKVSGVTIEMLKAALSQSKEGRAHILGKMQEVIATPRKEMSPYAPRINTVQINPEKIRDIIGPGGKVINQIIDETGVEIDIEDDGKVFVTSPDETSAKKALEWIDNLTREVRAGELLNGRITRLMNFGAFAEILPGQEGLIHISELSDKRVEKVEDVVKVGDVVPVKVKEIDSQGRINLSMKDAK
ncbi:polyribonucleotide nucleotidyltransferase [Patescibacteria group bacterium]